MTMPDTELILEAIKHVDRRLEKHEEATAERFASVDKLLRGNGSPGLTTKVDRLEQSEVRREFWTKTLLVAAVAQLGFVVKTIFWGETK